MWFNSPPPPPRPYTEVLQIFKCSSEYLLTLGCTVDFDVIISEVRQTILIITSQKDVFF